MYYLIQVWWCMPVILALRRLIYEDLTFKARLGYIARLHWKKEGDGEGRKKRKMKEKTKRREKTMIVMSSKEKLNHLLKQPHIDQY